MDLALQFELRDTQQVLAQNFLLDLELVLVAGVLVVASAAAGEMWAVRRDALRRRLYDCGGVCACEAGLFFGERGVDFLSGKNEGDKYSLAASALVGGKASESVAAVDEFFNV